MYNKLFTKILDSTIWLAPDGHRLAWVTMIAAMDEDGNAMFASAGNLAARARITREQAEAAIVAFEGPDPDGSDQEFEGRRIERIPGGWHLLNAAKYREMVTKIVARENTRQRTAKWRSDKAARDASVTIGDASVTPCLQCVTPSVSEAVSEAVSNPPTPRKRGKTGGQDISPSCQTFLNAYPRKTAKQAAIKAFEQIAPDENLLGVMLVAIARQRMTPEWLKDGGQFIPHPATWLRGRRWDDEVRATATMWEGAR